MCAAISYQLVDALITDTIPWEEFAYGVLESPTKVCFADLSEERPDCRAFDAGLLFGADSELRWRRRRSGKLHLVYIDDGGRGWNGMEPVTLHREGESQIVLWGDPQGNTEAAWYEPRIPRMITEYPKALRGKRLAVETVKYQMKSSESRGGPTFLFRCKNVVPLTGGGYEHPASL